MRRCGEGVEAAVRLPPPPSPVDARVLVLERTSPTHRNPVQPSISHGWLPTPLLLLAVPDTLTLLTLP